MKPQKITDLWQTHPDDVAFIRRVFGGRIDLDPCAGTEGTVRIADKKGEIDHVWCAATQHAETNYDADTDGLSAVWFGNVFCNPPYSHLLTWCEACMRWAERDGINVIAPLPTTPSTRWWQRYVAQARAVVLPAKRSLYLTHDGRAATGARHDSCYACWGSEEIATRLHDLAIAEQVGCVVRPYGAKIHEARQLDAFFGMGAIP